MDRILIVDDDPMFIESMASMLEPHYVTHGCRRGAEGLAWAKAHLPDLILLDVMMDDMNGTDVCQQLKQDFATRDIPVIFMTSLGSVDDETLGLSLGAIDYLSKPINKSIALARIANHLQLKRHEDALCKLNITMEDLVRQRNAEIRDGEARFRAVFEQTAVGVAQIDTTRGRFLNINRKYCEILGYQESEMLQLGFQAVTHPDDLAKHLANMERLTSGEVPDFEIEKRCLHKEGSIVWVHLSVSPMWKPGTTPDKHMEVVLDITQQKNAEATLRESEFRWKFALEGAGDGVWDWNLESGKMLFSHRWKEMLGYGDDDIGDSLEDWKRVVKPEDMTAAMMALESYMDGVEPPPYHAEYRMLCKDGSWKWALSRGMVVSRAIDGRPLRMIGTHTDITQQRQVESDMRQARDAAESANRAKDAFLANITHELRTPLAAVIGFSGLARPLATDARQRDYLDKVNSAGKTLSGIIDDLLDLSKIAAGRLDLEPMPFTLRQTIERSTSVASFKAQEKGLQLLECIDQDVPDVVVGDSLRLAQILINLLSNAVKFTAAGRIDLRVSVHARERARVCLDFEVKDTGVGLSEAGLAQLFKPFSQADSSMTRKFGGTGLGLAICKHLAELMEGEIGVVSREGSGSTFRVRLWFGLGVVGNVSLVEESTQETGRIRYQNAQVLVVDDQPFNRDIVEGLLAAVGIISQLAENGQQALDILARGEKTFDLILMDVQMPVMDGLTATRAIRKLNGFATLPVIAMTAHTMAHEKEQGAAAGMTDHIGKPFDEAGFYRVLAKWIPAHKQWLSAVAAPRRVVAHGLPPMCGIDIDAGLSLLLGDEARYRHWLGAFVADAPATVQQIRTALSAGQPQPASMAAHAMKGRMGLLGMSALQGLAAALETAIDHAQPADQLLLELERGVIAMCAEIRSALGLAHGADSTEPVAEDLSSALPPGIPPDSITRLTALLQTGDGDCDLALAACLDELKDTAWAPRLQQASTHLQHFDFAAAGRVLGANL